MSSSKYILNTDGTITKKTVDETEVIENIEDVTRDMISGFNDLESTRTSVGVIKASPPLILPVGGATDNTLLSKLDTAVSVDKEGLLKNDSFGTSEDITYYSQFNTIFPKQGGESSTSKVYAEELEMLAGFDLNSIGIFDFTKQSADFVKYTFILDYILESAAYIAVAEVVTRNLKEDNIGENVFYDYFYDVLNYPSFNLSSKVEPLAYFLIGINEFVNTDPKIDNLVKQDLIKKNNFLGITDISKILDPDSRSSLFLVSFLDNLLSLSKLEHNRILLLIRKFQQESHWHKNILYKAKKVSSENFADKLFVEFSQYYFKFIIERMHIGRMIWRRKLNIQLKKDKKVSGRNRLLEDRFKKEETKTIENKNYFWSSKNARDNGNNTHSISSLPQLFKTNSYIKELVLRNLKIRQNFDNTDQKGDMPQKRLDSELVKKIEEHLNNEYMPFYFQDLRTNEILAFHAFIDTISDSFSPSYNPSSGYGRIEDVQHYTKTTRTINTTFSLVAYNQEDHDLMWYQINKIVMMVYPQWSKGIQKGDTAQAYPFTQMPTASPLIRLRIGDVITSNYSKENLARLHTHGGKIGRHKVKGSGSLKFNYDIIDSDENVKLAQTYFRVHRDEDQDKLGVSKRNSKYIIDKRPISEADYDSLSDIDQKNYVKFVSSDVIIKKSKDIDGFNVAFQIDSNEDSQDKVRKIYKHESDFYIPAENLRTHSNKNNKNKYNISGKDVVDAKINGKINNPFTAAYESSRGEGLAGFITNLDINYNESTWQTEIKGSRAPMMVKITISFAPIHDIPPGLDHLGEMRAPVYNVGSINRKMFRTPYEDIDN